MSLPSLYLASASPRRRQLLDNLGFVYTVLEPSVTEAHPDVKSVDEVTQRNAARKAESVLSKLPVKEAVVIGADTLVVLEDEVMGKPKDPEEAKRMLRRLSGREHSVVTGLALLSPKYGSREASVTSRVRFRALSDKDIEDYASTKEPYDKAGSYAVQGLGMLFVERVEGSYSNVIGLPMETFLTELAALTGIALPHWFR